MKARLKGAAFLGGLYAAFLTPFVALAALTHFALWSLL